MLGGRPASGRDVVWKNRKRTSKKLEEILASPPLKRRPVTMLNPGKIPVFFLFWCPVRDDYGGFFTPGRPRIARTQLKVESGGHLRDGKGSLPPRTGVLLWR